MKSFAKMLAEHPDIELAAYGARIVQPDERLVIETSKTANEADAAQDLPPDGQ